MNPFSSKALVAIFAVGLITFGLGLLLAAFSPDVFDRGSAGNDTFSRSLVGHRALSQLLDRSGLVVVISRNAEQTRANLSFPLLLLEPQPALELSLSDLFDDSKGQRFQPIRDLDEAERIAKLIKNARSADAEVIVALPKWLAHQSALHPGWIDREHLNAETRVEALLADLLKAAAARDDLDVEFQGEATTAPELQINRTAEPTGLTAEALGHHAPRIDLGAEAQLLAPHDQLEALVACDQGVLIGRLSSGITLISDPDLFNNRGLSKGDHASLILRLLDDHLGAHGVVIDETLHGFTTGESLLGRAMRFPLGLISIHTLLAMILSAWALASRFGKALAPPPTLPPGKQLLMDNTSRLLLAGGDHAEALRRYLHVTCARLARRFALTGTEKAGRRSSGFEVERDLVPQLQALSTSRGVTIDLDALVRASREPQLKPAQALRLAQRIYAWRMAIQGVGSQAWNRSRSAPKAP